MKNKLSFQITPIMEEYYSEFYTFLLNLQQAKTYEMNQLSYHLSGKHDLQKLFASTIFQKLAKYPTLSTHLGNIQKTVTRLIDDDTPILKQINTINAFVDEKNKNIIDLSDIAKFFQMSHFNDKEIWFLKEQLDHYVGHRDIATVCIIKTQLELLE
ncbi:hypothetical protein DLEV_184 [Diachasmimorpha longicaudata entomopoxvirus]|uniref:Uncharacterized protein n=1 Tax=Diachasmimorpha longicaudata entomopoxvirus TaxID=109981 RepID=A0A7R5WFH9_9POXV|nr:hypothetical protein QKK69_gp184 [Diachasmimorpha longicaudata entomopoxvirus]AKS26475.1 hypothetical protein DLEV_184 [Diachasmimorpha longicaudata entomopoxvirus]